MHQCAAYGRVVREHTEDSSDAFETFSPFRFPPGSSSHGIDGAEGAGKGGSAPKLADAAVLAKVASGEGSVVFGWLPAGVSNEPLTFVAMTPCRLADTRSGSGYPGLGYGPVLPNVPRGLPCPQ